MNPREKLGELLNDFANAHYECGDFKEWRTKQYLEIWNNAVECEAKLLDFLEPYLPKE